jgi:hypothetical protein
LHPRVLPFKLQIFACEVSMRKIMAVLFLACGLSGAQAQVVITGNDTGGIIPWSPVSERLARAASAAHCSGYGKQARITSVYRQYGHYIGFSCAFPRGYVVRERLVIRTKG